VYGKRADAVVGSHWISYSGQLSPHRTDQLFDDKSIGYQVLTRKLFPTLQMNEKEHIVSNQPFQGQDFHSPPELPCVNG
jgi:hypothetical protein